VIKGEQKAKQQLLTAPVDGVVQQLAVHTIGGVVTPAQALAVVVTMDPNLEIEAMVSNRDIGFVVPGQSAAIKVDTFNFTRYGLLHGHVLSISRDAITRERGQATGAAGRRGERLERTQGTGTRLCGARQSRPQRDGNRGPARPAPARNGCYGRDQNRFAADHQLPAVASDAI
jgi:hemolysin D